MDGLLSLLIFLTIVLVSYFLNRKTDHKIYGIPFSKYDSLPHSQQKIIRQEWYLDNNQELINYVKNVSQRIFSNEDIPEKELIQLHNQIRDIEKKHEASGTNYLSYDIQSRIEANKKQSLVEDQGK